jgi:hypothetical protein
MDRGVTVAYDRERGVGESVVDWAVATGRIAHDDAAQWRAKPAAAEMILPVMAAGAGAWVGAPVAASTNAPRPSRVAGADPRWYALNPAVDELRTGEPTTFAAAAKHNTAPPPTLFETGDLPPFTASGIDPQLLADVPWMARHRVAATANRTEALAMIEDLAGEDGLDLAAFEYGKDLANRDYHARVLKWATDGAIAGDEQRAVAARARQQVAASSGTPAKTPEQMTDDEIEESLFGVLDRQRAARAQEIEDSIARGTAVGQGRGPRWATS